MRLKSLDLVRYGKFTGRRIEFGGAEAGKPDFHIIYGPNEAGKSTLFSAFLDLLFGIEQRSAYGFLHPYPTMRIGGSIETAGRTQDIFRVKRNQNTLIDLNDQPLPDTLFAAPLAGIDRAAYQMMFSLDDESIERGGEAILKSEGELGALLFSASSGLPDSAAVLARLRAEADGFYKSQGRKHRLAELKAELETLKAEKATTDTNAREFAALRKTRDIAAERHEAALTARADIQVTLDRLKAQRESLPLLRRLRAARSDLASFEALPDVPALWHELYPTLLREEADHEARLQQLDVDITRRDLEIADIAEDEAVLLVASVIEDIERSGLEARYRTAVYDMPSRIDERAKVAADIAVRLRQLGDDAAVVGEGETLITADIIGRIHALSQDHGTLAERLATAERELEMAREDMRNVEEKYPLDDGGDEEFDPQPLIDLVRRLHRSDCLQRQQAARREIAGLENLLADRMTALQPFSGNVESLLTLPVPSQADIATLLSEKTALDEKRQRLADRIAEEEVAIAGEQARLDELRRLIPFANDDAASVLRTARDKAWIDHTQTLNAESAALFETAMRRDDEAAVVRLTQSESIAQARVLTLSLAERSAKLSTLKAEESTLAERYESWAGKVAATAAACGLPQQTAFSRLESWLPARELALETRSILRAAHQELALAKDEEKVALDRLSRIFDAFGDNTTVPDDLAGALDLAERRIDAAEKRASAYREGRLARERASRTLDLRETAHATVTDEMANWTKAWRETLAATWLGKRTEVPSPVQLRPVLVLLQEIDKLSQKKADLDHRVEGMAKDQRQFAGAVEDIAARLAIISGNPIETFETVRSRLAEARRCSDLAIRLRRENDERQAEHQALIEKRERQQAQAAAMLELLGCDTLVEAGSRLEAAKARDGLRSRIAETEVDLCARMAVAYVEEAELVLAAVDEAGLARALAEQQARFEEADRDAGNLNAERREAERVLARVGGDDAAAHLEERRRTLLAEMEARALSYLRLRTGILASETALRLYRERHRSAMMQRASAAFSTVTGGEYEGLATQAEQGKEFLIAMQAGGASKLARDLSKGTRFQLYLALRMAGYHEIASSRESLPFIADDIMETFDDGRAGHAFALMGEMAKVGQVIYLTHHEHLCSLAQSACPDVVLHQL